MHHIFIETLVIFAVSFICITGNMLVRFGAILKSKRTSLEKSDIAIFAAQVSLGIAIIALIVLFIFEKLGIPRELSYFIIGIVFTVGFFEVLKAIRQITQYC